MRSGERSLLSAAYPDVGSKVVWNDEVVGTDHDWVAIYEVVEAGLHDANVLGSPPKTEEELGFLADTVTDHLAAALQRGDLAKRPTWRQP